VLKYYNKCEVKGFSSEKSPAEPQPLLYFTLVQQHICGEESKCNTPINLCPSQSVMSFLPVFKPINCANVCNQFQVFIL